VVIIVRAGTSPGVGAQLIERVRSLGFTPHPIYGVEKTVIAVIGDKTQEKIKAIETLPGVERVVPVLQPYKLAGREVKPEPTVIGVNGVAIGGPQIVVMAGPCAVESREQYRTRRRGGLRALPGGRAAGPAGLGQASGRRAAVHGPGPRTAGVALPGLGAPEGGALRPNSGSARVASSSSGFGYIIR
jgi:hypothetical protein